MSARTAVYLDANAAAPLRREAIEALTAFLSPQASGDSCGALANPSSRHAFGRQAKRLLSLAREQVALSLGLPASDADLLTFTSSGTEANQTVIRGVLEPLLERGEKPHWITTPVEHDSVLKMVDWVRARGGSVSFLPVDACGRPQAGKLKELFTPQTCLVSVIWANNETGVLVDVTALVDEIRAHGPMALLHLDGAQVWGKLPLNLNRLGAHFATFSGHKIGAPAGTGVVWAARATASSLRAPFGNLILGSQERKRRGGTENLLGLVALGAAANALRPEDWATRTARARDWFEAQLMERIPGARIHGAEAPRIANTSNLGFDGVETDALVMALDLDGFCVSAGSACASGTAKPSHVLQAMGLSEAQALGCLRVSLPDGMPFEILGEFVHSLSRAVDRVRNLN